MFRALPLIWWGHNLCWRGCHHADPSGTAHQIPRDLTSGHEGPSKELPLSSFETPLLSKQTQRLFSRKAHVWVAHEKVLSSHAFVTLCAGQSLQA